MKKILKISAFVFILFYSFLISFFADFTAERDPPRIVIFVALFSFLFFIINFFWIYIKRIKSKKILLTIEICASLFFIGFVGTFLYYIEY